MKAQHQTRRKARKREVHPLDISSIARELGRLKASGVDVNGSRVRSHFDNLYRRFEAKLLPGDTRQLERGTRVRDTGKESFASFVDAVSTTVADHAGNSVDRDAARALLWWPTFELRSGANEEPSALSRDLLAVKALSHENSILQRWVGDWWRWVPYEADLASAVYDNPRIPSHPLRKVGPSPNEAQVVWHYMARWVPSPPVRHNMFLHRDGSQRDYPDYDVPLRKNGWPLGCISWGESFEALGIRLFKKGLYIPTRKPDKPPHPDMVRQVLFRGLTKTLMMMRWTIAPQARLEVPDTFAEYSRVYRDATMRQVEEGLRDRSYSPHRSAD